MNNALDWDDYKTALQIAEAGSLSGAARLADSSHPTMLRRINAVEEKLGVRLFERFRTGYAPTAAGEEVVAVARQIAELTNETERRLVGRDLRPSGVVRVATTDTLLFALLMPVISRFRQTEPDITIEVIVSNEISDLSLREADIAIRPVSSPDQHLLGRKLGVIRQGIYASRELGLGGLSRAQFRERPWVGPSRSMAYPQLHSWMDANSCNEACVCRMNTVLGMHAAVQAGIGMAVLPIYLAEADAELDRIGGTVEKMAVDLWLLTHPDLRNTARVRTVLDYFAKSDLTLSQLKQ